MNVFQQEKEFCEIFKSEIDYNIMYEVNSKEINIIVRHNENFDVEKGKKRLNQLKEIFRLSYNDCRVLNYIDTDNQFINEYFFIKSLNKQKDMVDLIYKNRKLNCFGCHNNKCNCFLEKEKKCHLEK